MCNHERKTQARNVTAHIGEDGCLHGGDGYMWRGAWYPVRGVQKYDRLVFCSNPTCEQVFASERAAR